MYVISYIRNFHFTGRRPKWYRSVENDRKKEKTELGPMKKHTVGPGNYRVRPIGRTRPRNIYHVFTCKNVYRACEGALGPKEERILCRWVRRPLENVRTRGRWGDWRYPVAGFWATKYRGETGEATKRKEEEATADEEREKDDRREEKKARDREERRGSEGGGGGGGGGRAARSIGGACGGVRRRGRRAGCTRG